MDKFVQIAPGVNVSVGFSIMEGIQTYTFCFCQGETAQHVSQL